MRFSASRDDLIMRLKQQLPVAARCRRPLLVFPETRLGHVRAAPRLKVTKISSAQETSGVVGQFVLEGMTAGESVFVTPLKDIVFERRLGFAKQLRGSASRGRGACKK